MKPIKLQLTPDQLITLDNFMSQIDRNYHPVTLEGKAIKSISFKITDNLSKKSLEIQRNIGQLNRGKKVTQSLKYHEAFALFKLLNHLLPITPNIYLQKTHDFLHQKLQ